MDYFHFLGEKIETVQVKDNFHLVSIRATFESQGLVIDWKQRNKEQKSTPKQKKVLTSAFGISLY